MMKFIFGFIGFTLLLAILGVGCAYLNTATQIATAPARVASATLTTENIINSYDGFYALKSAIDARVKSIENYKHQTQDEPDLNEQRIMKGNLFAMRTVCQQTVAKYNANAEKLTSGFFRDNRLPQFINPETCEQ